MTTPLTLKYEHVPVTDDRARQYANPTAFGRFYIEGNHLTFTPEQRTWSDKIKAFFHGDDETGVSLEQYQAWMADLEPRLFEYLATPKALALELRLHGERSAYDEYVERLCHWLQIQSSDIQGWGRSLQELMHGDKYAYWSYQAYDRQVAYERRAVYYKDQPRRSVYAVYELEDGSVTPVLEVRSTPHWKGYPGDGDTVCLGKAKTYLRSELDYLKAADAELLGQRLRQVLATRAAPR